MTYTYTFNLPLCSKSCPDKATTHRATIRANGLNRDLIDAWLEIGAVFEADSDDFDSAYQRLWLPGPDGKVVVLARWHCPLTQERFWIRLDFELDTSAQSATLLTAETVELTPELVAQAHYIDDDAYILLEVLLDGPERDAIALAFPDRVNS